MDPKQFPSKRSGRPVRTQQGYWAFQPAPLPPTVEWSTPLITILTDAERELSRLATLAGQFPFPEIIYQPFIFNEAVMSSRIEGTRSSIHDLYTYEAHQLSFSEYPDDVREVHNYVQALHYGLERKGTLPISLRLLRELHQKLMKDVRGGHLTPGEFRRSQNWIGPPDSTLENAPFVPPPVDAMHETLDSLERYIHQADDLPVLIKVGLIHYQFEAIHPFLDGNGRIGRLLTILLLCDWRLLPFPVLNLSSYFNQHRQRYYDLLLDVSQKGKWEEWLAFFLEGIGKQSQSSIKRIQDITQTRQDYQKTIGQARNLERMHKIVDYLFVHPIFTIGQLSSDLEIPFRTAGDYVDKLISAGILQETTGRTRNRIFQANGILTILSENGI